MSLRAFLSIVVVQASVGFVGTAVADEPGELNNTRRPTLRIPMSTEAPMIDGALNDPVWTHAAVIEELTPPLTAHAPLGSAIAARSTTIRVFWDEEYLYLAVIAHSDNIFATGKLNGNDSLHTEDVFEIFLDPVGDGRMMIETQISPLNTVFDTLILLTAEPVAEADGVLAPEMRQRNRWDVPEWSWPSLRHGTGRLIENGKVAGWTAEMAFPAWPLLKRLGLRRFEPLKIRANIVRLDWLLREGEEKRLMVQSSWSPVRLGHAHLSPSEMGTFILEVQSPQQP